MSSIPQTEPKYKVLEMLDAELDRAKKRLEMFRVQFDRESGGQEVHAAMQVTLCAKEVEVLTNLRGKIVETILKG